MNLEEYEFRIIILQALGRMSAALGYFAADIARHSDDDQQRLEDLTLLTFAMNSQGNQMMKMADKMISTLN